MSPRNLRKPYVYKYSLMSLLNHYLSRFLSFFFLPSLYGFLLLKECLVKTVILVCNSLISLVKKLKSLSSGSYHKYTGFFMEWYLYVKNAIIAQPIWLVPTFIALGYASYYLYWAWWLGWRLALAIVRARILACLNHTARIIETTVIGKIIFGLSIALLSHSLGWVDLSPAHLEALLSEIFHVRNYIPTVVPLEPGICHEVIQAADTKVAIKPISEILKEVNDDFHVVYFENDWSRPGQVFWDQTTRGDIRLNGLPTSPITKAVKSMTFTTAPQPGKIFLAAVKFR